MFPLAGQKNPLAQAKEKETPLKPVDILRHKELLETEWKRVGDMWEFREVAVLD